MYERGQWYGTQNWNEVLNMWEQTEVQLLHYLSNVDKKEPGYPYNCKVYVKSTGMEEYWHTCWFQR